EPGQPRTLNERTPMANLRHILRNQPTEQTRNEIKADIAANRRAQLTAQANGQHRLAETLAKSTDAHLDELNNS
ncbi:hypothetical protein, partial [Streptomyces sp. NPDC090029]|uniref:hypothetical protein n=1 Tax=Streptomyces sp. NPDC090029 TaxID=3365924 RepID=UPI00381511B6